MEVINAYYFCFLQMNMILISDDNVHRGKLLFNIAYSNIIYYLLVCIKYIYTLSYVFHLACAKINSILLARDMLVSHLSCCHCSRDNSKHFHRFQSNLPHACISVKERNTILT